MRFLSDVLSPKFHKKIAIDSLFTAFSPKPTSHRGAWPKIIRDQILTKWPKIQCNVLYGESRSRWKDYDLIIMDMGMEFKGKALNFVGGPPPDAQARIDQWAANKTQVITWEYAASDIANLCKARFLETDFIDGSEIAIDHVARFNKLVIGDSHSLSVYRPGYSVIREDGKTLYGACKHDPQEQSTHLISRVLEYYAHLNEKLEDVTIYYGNIDIRHHVCRDTSWPRPYEMAKLLEENANGLLSGYEVADRVTLVPPLYIEDESRVIPKSGWFKGKPFWGSWLERDNYRILLTSEIGSTVSTNPCIDQLWWGQLPLQVSSLEKPHYMLDFEAMEKPRSVHLAQHSYQYNLNA